MKKILSLLLALTILFSTMPMSILAENTDVNNTMVSITAQADGAFVCAPQIDVSVDENTAESYGFSDSIKDGVSVADALVKLHEINYGESFTKDTAANYLAYSAEGYISKLFGIETTANGFVLNGAYPNDGTESDWGGYNGTTVTTQQIVDSDTVEFFIYSDDENWSDELAWFNYKGNAITEFITAPDTKVKLNLNSYSYMMSYQYIDSDEIHAVGSNVGGAQLAFVNISSGSLTPIDGAVTEANGNVSVTSPAEEGTYYLTAYIPEGTVGEPLIMSLTKITVDKDAPVEDPLALTTLSVASFDSNPDSLEMTPAFDSKIYEYSVPVVAYPSADIGVFKSVYVKAAAESEDAIITAECNGISKHITDASSWTMLMDSSDGTLKGGKKNILTITVAESADENAEKKVYTVIVPMKPAVNTVPAVSKESDTASVMLSDEYSVDLSEIFSDADEVDTLTYAVSVNGADAVIADEKYTFAPAETGTYTLVFTANDGTSDSAAFTVTLTVTPKLPKPSSITIKSNAENVIDGVVIVAKGDKFKLTALDENGNETPVTWKNKSANGGGVNLNEDTGEIEVINDFYSSGTSYLYFEATSALDETVKKEITIQASGYIMSEYQKAQTVALSTDGQTAKTASLSAGKNGYNIWSYNIPEGVAELASDPGKGGTIKFNVFRPGVIEVAYKLDINEKLTDTGTITVTGVAVEDSNGNHGKTYIGINKDNPNPTVQLFAFAAEGRTVKDWSSADESIATVDETGLVTAKGIGSTIITATDSEGTKGGIKVVCESEETPYFENLQFLSSAIKDYNTAYVFSPTTTEYRLEIKTYSTTKLTLQGTTLFDDDKYIATAAYTDINGKKQSVGIKNGAITYLEGIPFDESEILITLSDKNNAENKTVYTFNVIRPRDTTKTVKSNGFVLVPDGRSLLTTKYNGYAEGTMFKLLEDGSFKTGWASNLDTGVSGTHYIYKCFAIDGLERFSLDIIGNTVYEHLRYSLDGENYKELPQGGGKTDIIEFSDNASVTVNVQIIDDKTYSDNIKSDKDGFSECEPSGYTLTVEKAASFLKDAQILTAETDSGDWYPCDFDTDKYTYSIVVPKDVTEETLTYSVSDGATVKLGNTQQTAVDGVYTLALTTSQKSLTITSADGKLTNTYNFKIQNKSDGYPDKVVDFLCINSQYTNGVGAGNVASPWVSLAGTFISIGNFGGYITYYYDEPITDNPNNKYGIDFYVYGNANKDTSTSTRTSFFEPAQAWVSEDGENWYALAGSAHYDDDVIWDYSVTYEKASNGKTAWTDSLGNSNDGSSACGIYPSASVYNLNELVKDEKITLSGIVLPAGNGKIAVSGEQTDAYPVKWGYADCFANGTKGTDVNPYADNTNFDLQANGFDLKWAVDENGIPVDVSEKKFHYVKLVTASNIWHSSYGEKSPEISGVLKTTAQAEAVGKTTAPTGITITDGADTKMVRLNEERQVYSIDIGDMKYVSISLNGASEDDNIYINNTRISYNETASGFKITKESGEKLVRIIVQNGEKEPLIYLLKIKGTATESSDLIEGIKLDVNGSIRATSTNDGNTYTSSVGYRIDSVGIYPVADSDINVTINGDVVKDEYSLVSGENTFTVVGEKDGITHSITLKINRDSAPVSSGKITVYFTLLGDEKHGESDDVHTLKKGGLDTWISKTAMEIDAPATVLDVFEKALGDKYTFVNADGNYISEIDGLAEFDNGALSGWMYTLNKSHTSKGVAEQTVKNGDSIVFYYTDDYTQEQSSEKWQGNASSSPKNNNTDKEETKADETDKEYEVQGKNTFSETTFTDVKKDDWHYESVKYVYENNLMNGTGNGFEPESKMSRAMLVTVLYRMANPESADNKHNFADVSQGMWYSDAVAWAASNGIVSGINLTEFAPDSDISREQMALIIYRFAKIQGYDVSGKADVSMFADADDISDWALDAIQWVNKTKLVNGTGEVLLSPKSTATRAQVAAILMRFCENVAN